MEKEKGYVYILTNPAFRENWVKIGKTTLENTQMLILIAKIQIYLYISNIFCTFAPDLLK